MSRRRIAALLLCIAFGMTVVRLASTPEVVPRETSETTPPPPQANASPAVDVREESPRPVKPEPPAFDTRVSRTTGMKFVRIKAGTFQMGSPNATGYRQGETQHEVVLTKDFYMGRYEVTRGQFRQFVNDTGLTTEAESGGGGRGWVADRKKEEQSPEYSWLNPGFGQTADHPVVNVTWNDAVKFADWLSCKDGRKYRLPTESEWEYAARAGSTAQYAYGPYERHRERLVEIGNTSDASGRRVRDNVGGIRADDGYAFTAPVGSFRGNAFGLHDMFGNAWEWCGDWYGRYPAGRVTDPQGLESTSRNVRVGRGGGYADDHLGCDPAHRGKAAPDYRSNSLGFRLVMEADTPGPQSPPQWYAPPRVAVIPQAPPPRRSPEYDFSKTTGMKFVRVRAGTFLMGLPKSDRDSKDHMQHEVTLKRDFSMGVYEVTRAEFRKFVDDTGYKTQSERDGKGVGWSTVRHKWEQGKEYTWLTPGFEQTEDHPVVLVNCDDAVKFAEWLSQKDGRKYRLPSEGEWEYAFSVRSTPSNHFGDSRKGREEFANVADVTLHRKGYYQGSDHIDDGFAFTAPVGSFRPNGLGLYDLHGNVSEWCSNRHADDSEELVIDPQGSGGGRLYVFRGGGWGSRYSDAMSRSSGLDNSSSSLGFRLVMDP